MQCALILFVLQMSKKKKTIQTANRRQREDWLRVEQRLLKKRLREMPDDQVSVKKKLSEVKERILVIARAENTRKRQKEK